MRKKTSRNKKKIRVRRLWKINPRTKVKESAKRYSRTKKKKELKDILKEFL